MAPSAGGRERDEGDDEIGVDGLGPDGLGPDGLGPDELGVDESRPDEFRPDELRHDGRGGATSWSGGRALAGRGASLMLWAAIACGPLALAASALTPVHGAESAGPVIENPQETTGAEAYAVTFVGAWLRATTTAPEPFATLLPGAVIEATVPTSYRDLAVAATDGPGDSGVVAVTVSALIDESGPGVGDDTDDGAGADTTDGQDGGPGGSEGEGAPGDADTIESAAAWVPRYFQVSVATIDGLGALGEPAAVAPPPPAAAPPLPAQQLAVSTEAGTAAVMFLSAYLTSSPELERFVAPDAAIAPLPGAPYVSVTVRDLRTQAHPESPPATGDRVEVRASVSGMTRAETMQALSYWLVLSARDGRWEVASIAAGPTTASGDGVDGGTDTDDRD
ncbi:MAG: hypothetical protein ACTH31_02180 [Pseudoclavibacter sp.]